jgi:hypothetical protein
MGHQHMLSFLCSNFLANPFTSVYECFFVSLYSFYAISQQIHVISISQDLMYPIQFQPPCFFLISVMA